MPNLGIIASSRKFVTPSTYSDVILATSGLVSYWRLGETSGTFADSKGVNTGSLVGTDATRGVTGLINDTNKAITFGVAGTTRVNIANNASLDLGDVWSLELWFKRSEIGTGSVFGFIDRGSGAYQTQLRFGVPSVSVVGTGSICTSTGGAITNLNAHHVVGTKNGNGTGTVFLYVDGVSVGNISSCGAVATNNGSSLGLGSDAGGGENFNGTIDEVAIYSVPLTQAQVANHYNKGVNG